MHVWVVISTTLCVLCVGAAFIFSSLLNGINENLNCYRFFFMCRRNLLCQSWMMLNGVRLTPATSAQMWRDVARPLRNDEALSRCRWWLNDAKRWGRGWRNLCVCREHQEGIRRKSSTQAFAADTKIKRFVIQSYAKGAEMVWSILIFLIWRTFEFHSAGYICARKSRESHLSHRVYRVIYPKRQVRLQFKNGEIAILHSLKHHSFLQQNI